MAIDSDGINDELIRSSEKENCIRVHVYIVEALEERRYYYLLSIITINFKLLL